LTDQKQKRFLFYILKRRDGGEKTKEKESQREKEKGIYAGPCLIQQPNVFFTLLISSLSFYLLLLSVHQALCK
jgi:hypothetical protein